MKINNEMTDDQFFMELGRRLRVARSRMRLKQEQLAAQSGISRSALAKLESGDGGVRLYTFVAVMRTMRLLHGLEIAIPPVEPTPEELLEMERHRKVIVTRVCDRKKKKKSIKVWGDGTEIRK